MNHTFDLFIFNFNDYEALQKEIKNPKVYHNISWARINKRKNKRLRSLLKLETGDRRRVKEQKEFQSVKILFHERINPAIRADKS